METPAASRFLQRSAAHLRGTMARIAEAAGRLDDAGVWEREGAACNCVGNLLLHLEGNVRQHVISGLTGAPDGRDRPGEFAATGGHSRAALIERLEATVAEAAAAIEAFPPAKVLERRRIQGKEVVLLDDILHVAEHFSYHAGQIIHMVKARTERGFPWYAYLEPKP
jgi:uncharacterized damage-inducible protein DinB